jgi:hypothetical protein
MNMNRVMGTNLWIESVVRGKPCSAAMNHCDRALIGGRRDSY